MSLRPVSMIERKTSRPIRPKPLIATRTAIINPSLTERAGPDLASLGRQRNRFVADEWICLKPSDTPGPVAQQVPEPLRCRTTGQRCLRPGLSEMEQAQSKLRAL